MFSNSDLDFEVARLVFNINPESYQWGVPFFSEDRNASAMVNTEMAFRKDGTKEVYIQELERRALQAGWKSKPHLSDIAVILSLLLPEDICKAAITACHQAACHQVPSRYGVVPSDIDIGHH
jgi:hypothetical protein